jgi:folate-binding protein YgfZ
MTADQWHLRSLAVVRVNGADAVPFLQGQVTNDVVGLDDRSRLAAYTTAQGRVIALLRLLRRDDALYALLPAELAPGVIDRLRRFVLRAKVRIDLLDDWSVTGLQISTRLATPSAPAASETTAEAGLVFDYPDGRRAIARRGAAADEAVTEQWWQAADIAAGVPQVGAETSEHYVPQMLNLDLLEAISFSKGCYTGQEIVARTQNLGRIKRRTFRYAIRSDEAPPPLTALNLGPAKVGEVIMSARVDGGAELLAVVALDARDRPLRTATGHTAVPLPLPYAVP